MQTVRDIQARQAPRAGGVVPSWVGWLVISAGVLMLPWVAGLLVVLPTHHEAAHYRGSWVGFDLALCAMVLRTGWLARKGEHIELSATVTGTLLLVDCWFDVVTADTHRELLTAVALALFSELPLAVIFFRLAGRVEFRRRRQAEATAEQPAQWPARCTDLRPSGEGHHLGDAPLR